jgi:hypothetical protein
VFSSRDLDLLFESFISGDFGTEILRHFCKLTLYITASIFNGLLQRIHILPIRESAVQEEEVVRA